MTDTQELVKRLREAGDNTPVLICDDDLYSMAADTIESLQRRVEEAEKNAERLKEAGSYEYGLLKKCFAALNPNTNPRLIREIASYLAGPLPEEQNTGASNIGGAAISAAIDKARSEGGKP